MLIWLWCLIFDWILYQLISNHCVTLHRYYKFQVHSSLVRSGIIYWFRFAIRFKSVLNWNSCQCIGKNSSLNKKKEVCLTWRKNVVKNRFRACKTTKIKIENFFPLVSSSNYSSRSFSTSKSCDCLFLRCSNNNICISRRDLLHSLALSVNLSLCSTQTKLPFQEPLQEIHFFPLHFCSCFLNQFYFNLYINCERWIHNFFTFSHSLPSSSFVCDCSIKKSFSGALHGKYHSISSRGRRKIDGICGNKRMHSSFGIPLCILSNDIIQHHATLRLWWYD